MRWPKLILNEVIKTSIAVMDSHITSSVALFQRNPTMISTARPSPMKPNSTAFRVRMTPRRMLPWIIILLHARRQIKDIVRKPCLGDTVVTGDLSVARTNIASRGDFER